MVAGMIVDIVAEGMLILPAGVYTYAGGHLALFPHAYHKYPLTEAPTVGAIIAGLGALRYFKDDQGRTMVERGIDKVNASSGRKNLLRFAAITGMINVLVLCCYNIPNAILGAHSTAWPKDIQQRSYLTDHICGAGTDRAVPGVGGPALSGQFVGIHERTRQARAATWRAAATVRPVQARERRAVHRAAVLAEREPVDVAAARPTEWDRLLPGAHPGERDPPQGRQARRRRAAGEPERTDQPAEAGEPS